MERKRRQKPVNKNKLCAETIGSSRVRVKAKDQTVDGVVAGQDGLKVTEGERELPIPTFTYRNESLTLELRP